MDPFLDGICLETREESISDSPDIRMMDAASEGVRGEVVVEEEVGVREPPDENSLETRRVRWSSDINVVVFDARRSVARGSIENSANDTCCRLPRFCLKK